MKILIGNWKAYTIVLTMILLITNGLWIIRFVDFKPSDHLEYEVEGLEEEEYVWIGTMIDNPMYIAHDRKALLKFAQDFDVKISIEGPRTYDIPGQIATIMEVIKRRPSGIMVLGMEQSLSPAVNAAIEAGIPTITVDADLVNSKRIAHVGSDWYSIGVKQAEAMVKLVGGKGKIALLGIVGADNMQQGFDGFRSVIADYPDIYIIGEYDDMADIEEAKRITNNLIKTHPDLAGIAGFDTNSGPGIGAAIVEMEKVGQIIVTCVDIEPQHIELLKDGVVHKLIGQKRELFTYYGATLLYDYNHKFLKETADYFKNGVSYIPYVVDTGLIEVDINNVDYIMNDNQQRR